MILINKIHYFYILIIFSFLHERYSKKTVVWFSFPRGGNLGYQRQSSRRGISLVRDTATICCCCCCCYLLLLLLLLLFAAAAAAVVVNVVVVVVFVVVEEEGS